MARFTPQPDEGYSEDPLTALGASSSFPVKPRDEAVAALGSARSADEFPSWLIQHISSLSISRKTELTMALLNDLPTTVISQIVDSLYPRLYIDFVRYLPPEVCLKILGYLDPISLINVARCCRAWYNLALDRKLWEQLYYLEGWKALPGEIAAAEREINEPASSTHGVPRRMQSQDDGHVHKKRALSLSPTLGADTDTVMVDAGSTIKLEPAEMEPRGTSIFGGPVRRPMFREGVSQQVNHLDTGSGSSSKGKGVDTGKPRACSPASPESAAMNDGTSPRLAKSTLWARDALSRRFKINWKYLYTMRRRLESNWDLGRYINFQFPHPDHPEEGHGECIYSLQYNSQYLVSGSRDRTLKVWDMRTRRCLRTLAKHRGSVLCLQFDSDPEEDLIVSGSSDSDVIIWKFSTGQPIQTLKYAHRESVLNVKFDKRILVTCSKDKTIKIFNRKPLRYGDLGYQEVDPVPTNVRDYGYNIPRSPEDFPVTPAWTMIGCLEGHNAAVNAVQIHDREVVSASGDRHIKVWDWPTQVCARTIIAHNKGIACVQYDGRRIVSGSSDNEVKVFDRQTGLEVANLRAHFSLVRTVQAGFGDLPFSVEEDLAEAKKVDQEYFKAVESGLLEGDGRWRPGVHQGNAGSRRPEDIRAYGAKLPPGGGGGKYGRIVSGSYDATIIIWRRDKEGVWKDQHHFKQEEASFAALRQDRTHTPTPSAPGSTVPPGTGHPSSAPAVQGAATATANVSSQPPSAPPRPPAAPTLPRPSAFAMQPNQAEGPHASAPGPNHPPRQMQQIINVAVLGGQQALAEAIAAHPAILTYRGYVESAIDRLPNPVVRSQLRHVFSSALIRTQFEQARQRREALRNQEPIAPGPSSFAAAAVVPGSSSIRPPAPAQAIPRATPVQVAAAAAAAAHQAHAHVPQGPMHQVLPPAPAPVPAPPVVGAAVARPVTVPAPPVPAPVVPPAQAQQHHPHIAQAPMEVHDPANPARVFKLQYDARRIICCSQRSVIVGWDFCNGDPELEEASRFFGRVD